MKRDIGIKIILIFSIWIGYLGAETLKVDTRLNIKLPKVDKKLNYAEGEVMVKYKSHINKSNFGSMVSPNVTSYGFEVKKRYTKVYKDNVLVHIKSKKTTKEMIEILKKNPNVESVTPNYIYHLYSTPDDTHFESQWSLNNDAIHGGTEDADIDAVEAWDVNTGSRDIVVAVIDTGIDYTHTDLRDNLWVNEGETADNDIDDDGNGYIDDIYGYDILNKDNDPWDDSGHGTHVSGIIGASGDDGIGITGVNWSISMMTLKVFGADGRGSHNDIIEAIEYIITMKIRGVNIVAVNASFGSISQPNNDIRVAIDNLLNDENIIFCAAAGNDNFDNDANESNTSYPASYDLNNIISVAGTNRYDGLYSQTNFGLRSVDLAAPGENIFSTHLADIEYIPQEGDFYFLNMDDASTLRTTNGSWRITNNNFHSANTAITDSLANYGNNESKGFFDQNAQDLTQINNDNLSFGFWAVIDTEIERDRLQLFFSANGGLDWTYIEEWSGEDLPMQSYSVRIPREFQTDSFMYAFQLVTNNSITHDGVYIDDIGIGIGTVVDSNYRVLSGTSMAAPHVTGAVALLAAEYPTDTMLLRKNKILATVDRLEILSNRVTTGGRLNINNAIRARLEQGTEEFITGNHIRNVSTYFSSSLCGVGEQEIQGTSNCISTEIVAFDDGYLPTCADGEGQVQGTEECLVIDE